MANAIPGPAGPHLQTLFEAGTAAGLSDRELLERFLARVGSGAEAAFAALVERHGAMVLRVCRDVLRDPTDADDAFQATFLLLSRRAGAIRKRESVGPWLYGVALRVARCSLRQAARRRDRERRSAEMKPEAEVAAVDRLDAAPLLHEEVGRLPEAHRAALVLCYFEGLSHEQAAGQLGWPVGTLRSRLARGRDKLRSRLVRRGLAPSVGFLAASAASEGTSAVVPLALAAATVGIAMRAAQAGAVPASVAALAGQVLRVMTMTKLSMIATGFLVAGLVASAGVRLVAAQQSGTRQDGGTPPTVSAQKPVAPATGGDTDSVRSTKPAVERAGVLEVKLNSLIKALKRTEELHKRAVVSDGEVDRARDEAMSVAEQILGQKDELRDELELAAARLDVKKTELAAADADFAQAKAGEAGATAPTFHMSKGNLFIKKAEVKEQEVRMNQLRRRLAGLEPVAKLAESFLAESSAAGKRQTEPVPPSAPK